MPLDPPVTIATRPSRRKRSSTIPIPGSFPTRSTLLLDVPGGEIPEVRAAGAPRLADRPTYAFAERVRLDDVGHRHDGELLRLQPNQLRPQALLLCRRNGRHEGRSNAIEI